MREQSSPTEGMNRDPFLKLCDHEGGAVPVRYNYPQTLPAMIRLWIEDYHARNAGDPTKPKKPKPEMLWRAVWVMETLCTIRKPCEGGCIVSCDRKSLCLYTLISKDQAIYTLNYLTGIGIITIHKKPHKGSSTEYLIPSAVICRMTELWRERTDERDTVRRSEETRRDTDDGSSGAQETTQEDTDDDIMHLSLSDLW